MVGQRFLVPLIGVRLPVWQQMEKINENNQGLLLEYAYYAPDIWRKLATIERTSWVMHGVKT